MNKTNIPLTQAALDAIFPAERTAAFFDALYGEAEEGAYDIRLLLREAEAGRVLLAYELRRRPGKCLVCSLTYGLPQVFQRHPVIDLAGTVKEVGRLMGWPPESVQWTLGRTEEHDSALHRIPLEIRAAERP